MKQLKVLALAWLLACGSSPAFADMLLKQSTASQAVKFGPFVSSTDGNTESTGLTIANTDIKCSKNGGTIASKNSGGGTHDANGFYTVTFDATDTNTVGRFQCYVHVSGALPVYQEFNIVEEAIYDGLYNTNSGTSTTILPVNTLQVAGTAQTARDLGTSVLISSGTGTGQLSVTSGVIASNVTQAGGSAISQSGGLLNANTTQVAGSSLTTLTGAYPSLGIIDSGTAQAATGTTLQIRSAATFADNELNGATIIITGGTTGVGQRTTVSSGVGSTDTLTVPTWTTTPTGTITYVIWGTSAASGGAAPTVAQIATGIFQDTTSGDFTVAGSIGKSLFTSGATPGASGGLQIAGSNAPTTYSTLTVSGATTLTGTVAMQDGLTVTRSTSNTSAITATGNGTGNGALFTSGSGATGNGIQATAASTNGNGVGLTATGSGLTMTMTPANAIQVGGQTASASGTVTFPNATLASTTNITAGTITTATNLTTNNDKTGYALSATGMNSVLCTEPSAVPTWSSTSVVGFVCWNAAWSVNKVTQTATTKTLRNSADSGNLETCTVSDNGTTFTLGKCSP